LRAGAATACGTCSVPCGFRITHGIERAAEPAICGADRGTSHGTRLEMADAVGAII
jgi:hypothetical protein